MLVRSASALPAFPPSLPPTQPCLLPITPFPRPATSFPPPRHPSPQAPLLPPLTTTRYRRRAVEHLLPMHCSRVHVVQPLSLSLHQPLQRHPFALHLTPHAFVVYV